MESQLIPSELKNKSKQEWGVVVYVLGDFYFRYLENVFRSH